MNHPVFPTSRCLGSVVAALLILSGSLCVSAPPPPTVEKPLVGEDVVFEEVGGVIAAEAEHYYKQTLTDVRSWRLTTFDQTPAVTPDGDPNHAATASGGAYLEVLPDTRRSDRDKLITGQNFSNEPGKLAVLHYKVHFSKTGRYYVWARIYSTGAEDNGLHVGLDGAWPASGQRMQWVAKQRWAWDSKQRTAANHGGEKYKLYLDIDKPGEHEIQFAMREDGTEFDKWMMTQEKLAQVTGAGPTPHLKSGTLPAPFPVPAEAARAAGAAEQAAATPKPAQPAVTAAPGVVPAALFDLQGSDFYLDRGKWLAINPNLHKRATAKLAFPFDEGVYSLTFQAVGENDGRSKYTVSAGGRVLGTFESPLSKTMYAEGPAYSTTWKDLALKKGEVLTVTAEVGSEEGQEFSRGRFSQLAFARADGKPLPSLKVAAAASTPRTPAAAAPPGPPLHGPRKPDGDGTIVVTGELKQWHNVTFSANGPYAHELDNAPNPFTDYAFSILFKHETGGREYNVPGYFAADGNAANTSAESGTVWRVHFRPDRTGKWTYRVSFRKGKGVAVTPAAAGEPVAGLDGKTGTLTIGPSDKTGRDLRAKGRLEYVGQRYLRFAGTGEYFLKEGADAPENFLAYADFDGDFKSDGIKDNLVKTWEPHVRDWRPGDPTWGNGRGKGIVGALNYLASKGMVAVSFLTMNIGGDDRNVFPYVSYSDYTHLDCSRMDQWEVVLNHAEQQGLFLHFKTQEAENECLLDNGDTGPQRSLYYRELIARFGHHLALNWNLGEENGSWGRKAHKQSTEQRIAMAQYFADHDPYHGHIVIHNGQPPTDLLGDASALTGFSLQTNNPKFINVHARTLEWIEKSKAAGRPWAVACDEPGDASHALVPDADDPTHDYGRMNALWGNLLAGGWGCEWYFGYKHAHSDLTCQDYRSRDLWWDQCRVARDCFYDNAIPFWEMTNADELVGNPDHANTTYCFAKPGSVYLVLVRDGAQTKLDLSKAQGAYSVQWFNPRQGGPLQTGSVAQLTGGSPVALGAPPAEPDKDWLALVRVRP